MFVLKVIQLNAKCPSCKTGVYSEYSHEFPTIDKLREWITLHPDPDARYRMCQTDGFIIWNNPVGE